MKDEKLEKQFEEYFHGVKIPDDITADAKKHVKSKSTVMPTFLKFASVAASFVLVLTATLLIVFNTRSAPPVNDDLNGGDASNGVVPFIPYGDEQLSFSRADAYTISEINPSLKFIGAWAFDGGSVENCSAGYLNGELALVKAEVSLIYGFSRHDTEVFVEFTDENTVYSPLKDYADGIKGNYKGVDYYTTSETAENGEPMYKLHFTYNRIKYYFNIASLDEYAYFKYLQTIIK